MSGMEFDAAIGSMTGGRVVRFPSWLARALEAEGLNRVHGTVTDEGIVLRPYKGDHKTSLVDGTVSLPDWGTP